MKKILLLMTALIALSLTSCQKDYKKQGEEMAKQLDELCQKQDGDAVLALEENINNQETKIQASGDEAGLKDFRDALKDVRLRNAAYISSLKVEHGQDKDSVVGDLINDALINEDVDITAVTSSIDAINEKEAKKK
jgi:hypothetical protein